MGYTTNFTGRFELDKPLKSEHLGYINKFSEQRHMKRDAKKAEKLPDPFRHFVDLPIGAQGEYFVGGERDNTVLDGNKPPDTQPGLWCEWIANEGGTHIEWNGGEKFNEYTAWLKYICSHFLNRWGYKLNGAVTWEGEERSDIGLLQVIDNEVQEHRGRAAMVAAKPKPKPKAASDDDVVVELLVQFPKKLLDSYKKSESDDDAFEIANLAIEAYEAP